jgi:ABC-type Fe3+-hydroxamate transport system substrate-binding protein
MKKLLIGMSATIALLAGCSSSSSTDTTVALETTDTAAVTTAVVEINLIVGENTGADMMQTVPLGSSVRITVVNPNGADEIHVHGYDISTGEMAQGQEAVIEFVASNAGTFDIESHVSEEVVLVLTVE